MTDLFAGPGDDVWAVEAHFYDHRTVIDAGVYLERITCPRCGADIALDWLGDWSAPTAPVSTAWTREFRAVAPLSA